MKQIIIMKPNSISEVDKQYLKDNECIVIEHENPLEVRIIKPLEGFEGNDIIECLIGAIESTIHTDTPKIKLAQLLMSKLKTKNGA
jgi:hypothetical protein